MSETDETKKPQSSNAIRSLQACEIEGKRVRAVVDLVDEHEKPNVELILLGADEEVICRSLILGTNTPHIEFTLHIRGVEPVRPLRLKCVVSTQEALLLDEKSIEVGGIS